jgi:hypothetical protein
VGVLAAFVDGAVVGAAQQYQVGQVGGAAVEPVAQVVGVAPGDRSVAAAVAAAAVADRQRGALGRRDHAGGAADLQGWVGAPPRAGGSSAIAACSRAGRSPVWSAVGPSWVGWWLGWPGSASWSWWWWVAMSPAVTSSPWVSLLWWRVTSTRVTAASQASRRTVSVGSGPTQPAFPPGMPGWPSRLARSMVTVSWGRTPPLVGSRPPSSARRANSVNASARRCDALRSSALAGRARGSRAASRVWPASGSSSPSMATIPSKEGETHSPRRSCSRWACA